MKKLKLITIVLLFFVVGETLVRIDKKFDILNNAPKLIDTIVEPTDLKQKVDSNSFLIDSTMIRVLVLGDSYIYGGGIDPNKKFSKRLIKKFEDKNPLDKQVVVLDISRPDNNTLDNYNSFEYYNTLFKPHLVFWAYNFNDVKGGLDPIEINSSNEKEKVSATPPKRQKKNIPKLKAFTKKLYNFSELVRFSSAKLQKELKVKGLVLPFGEFYHLTHEVYQPTNNVWKQNEMLILEAIKTSRESEIDFIFYKIPEFNLLEKNDLFSLVDKTLMGMFKNQNDIIYIDGYQDFKDEKIEDYIISKYDGHPNENAHSKMAERAYREILKLY